MEACSHPNRRLAVTVLIALMTLSWAALSATSLERIKPEHQVYVARVSGYKLVSAHCTLAGPVYVGAPRGSGNGSLVALPYRALVLPGFRASASCSQGGLVALAGSYNGRPALAIVDPLAASATLAVAYADSGLWGRFSSIDCRNDSIAAAGLANGRILVALGPLAGRAQRWIAATLDVPGRPRAVLAYGGSAHVLLYDGRVLSLSREGALQVRPTPPSGFTLYPRGLAPGPGGPWLFGRARASNDTWGFMAPLNGGQGYLLRSRGHGGTVMSAYWQGGRWLVYYRPCSYWDSLLASTPSGGFSGVRLLWTGQHSVESVSPAVGGFDTGTIVIPGWRVVIACFRGLGEASYWLGGKPVAHVTLIPSPEAVESLRLNIEPPEASVTGYNRVQIESRPLRLSEAPAGRVQWLGAAEARWLGPLYAASFAGLGIVFFALALRGFGCR